MAVRARTHSSTGPPPGTALTAGEHAALGVNIWQIFAPAYPAALFGGQPFGLPHVPILRPVSDRSGSRRLIWAE